MSSIGRRVSLVKIIKEVFPDVYIIGGDCIKTAPALNSVNKSYELPYNIDEHYARTVLEICRKERVNVVIPLIDTELEIYAKFFESFKEAGIFLMVSDKQAIRVTLDKLETFHYYRDSTFLDLPFTALLQHYDSRLFSSKKIILKPKRGSSGAGIHIIDKGKVNALSELLKLDRLNYIAQEYIDFDAEVTVDAFVYENKVVEMCQRKRLKVRGGEVEQAITIKDRKITQIVESMVETISFRGVINIQIMIKNDQYFLGEVNARFGGGFPLSYYAGANLIEHLHININGKQAPRYGTRRYKEGFCMLRYDDAVYIEENKLNDKFSTL